MVKLHQQLEQLFKYRVNSNSEIIPYIKKLAESGKFDEPKKVAVFAIILDRLGKIEDETIIEDSLKAEDISKIEESVPVAPVEPETEVTQPETPTQTEATTSPDAPTEPEVVPEVQTPVESTPEVPATPETPVNNESDERTVAEFSLEAIADKPAPTPPVENAE